MKKFLIAFIALFIFSGVSFGQTDCIQLPKELTKLIKNPLQYPTDPFGKSQEYFDVKTQNEIIDYLLAFNNELKNPSNKDYESEANSLINNVKSNSNYLWAKNVLDNSKNYDEVRKEIENKFRTTEDIEVATFLVLWDYQLQILNNTNYSNTQSKDWGCVGSWAAAGAAAGAPFGGFGGIIGGIIGGGIGVIICP